MSQTAAPRGQAPSGITFTVNGVARDTTEKIAAADSEITEDEVRNRAHAESLTAEQRAALERVLRERATPTPEMVAATEAARAEYLAARAAWRAQRAIASKVRSNGTNGHGTVVRRAESSGAPRSSPSVRRVRTESSGEDPPDDPAPAERRCRACSELFVALNHRWRYCPNHRGDRTLHKRVERESLPSDPYWWPSQHELKALIKRAAEGCRCNGRHIPNETGGCSKCGHGDDPEAGIDLSAHTCVTARAPRRKSPRLGDGSPKRVFTDEHGRVQKLPVPEAVEEVVAA